MRNFTLVLFAFFALALVACDDSSQTSSEPAQSESPLDAYRKSVDSQGKSYIPVPINNSTNTGIIVPEEEEIQEDPLERWRLLQEERAQQQREQLTLAQDQQSANNEIFGNPNELSSKVIDRGELNNKRIAETHNLQIQVEKENLAKLYNRDFDYCIELGCNITSTSMEAFRSAYIHARIPPENLGRYLDFVSDGLGALTSHKVDVDDHTLKYIDTQSKLENQEALRERLIKLLNKEDVSDIENILKIENALARVERELDSAKRSLRHLETVTGMATVKISYHIKYVRPKLVEPKFTDNFKSAGENFKNSVAELIQFIAKALPWIIFWLIVLWALIKTIKFALRNRKTPFFGRFKKSKENEKTACSESDVDKSQ